MPQVNGLSTKVAEGRWAVDESFVTGEPLPVEKAAGDAVIGGSINGAGTLLVRVTAVGEQSFPNKSSAASRTRGRSSPASCTSSTACSPSMPPAC